MPSQTAVSRAAGLIAWAVAGIASAGGAQTPTYALRVSGPGIPTYNGTAQVTSVPAGPNVVANTYTLTVRGTGNASGFVFNIDGLANPRLLCSIGPGGVTTGTCETQYPAGQTVFLSSDAGLFVSATRYFGCGSVPFGDSCRFVIDGPRTIFVGWVAPEIIVYGAGDGTGRVTGAAPGSDNAALNCVIAGTDASGTCTATWARSAPPGPVTLTATATGNSVFAGWSGRCTGTTACVVQVAQLDSLKVTATFTTPSHVLAIASAGSGNGRVTSTPAKLECTITNGVTSDGCSTHVAQGSSVTLTADPSGGSTFGGWSGACAGTQPTCVLVVNTAMAASARFAPPRPAAELALALFGRLTLSDPEQRELDRFGNNDGAFNLGDLLALLSRTGERISAATLSELLHAQRSDERTP